jgi:hypothetical protein
MVESSPDASALPITQPPPAGDRAVAAKFAGGQQPPGDAGAELVDDPGQSGAVVDAGPAATAAWGWGEQGLDGLPKLRVSDHGKPQLEGLGDQLIHQGRDHGIHHPGHP